MKISVVGMQTDGTVVAQRPAVSALNHQQAVEYLALHFRGQDRRTLEAALNYGGLASLIPQIYSTYTVQATITR